MLQGRAKEGEGESETDKQSNMEQRTDQQIMQWKTAATAASAEVEDLLAGPPKYAKDANSFVP